MEEDKLMGDMVVVDVVDVKVEMADEDQLMNDHVRFGTYHRLDFNINLEGQSLKLQTTLSKLDLIALINPSIVTILVERLCNLSPSPAIVGKQPKSYIT